MLDKDWMADKQKKQACQGETNHIGTIPQISSVKGQKNRHVRGHNKGV